mgnify:CR=1 FL=1
MPVQTTVSEILSKFADEKLQKTYVTTYFHSNGALMGRGEQQIQSNQYSDHVGHWRVF